MSKPTPPRAAGAPRPSGAHRTLSLPVAQAAAPPPEAAPDPKAPQQKKKLKDVDWRQKQYFAEDGLQGPDPVRRTTSLEMPAVAVPPAPLYQEAPDPTEAAAEAEQADQLEEAAPAERKEEARPSARPEKRGSTFIQSSQVNLRNPGALPPPGPMPKGRLFEALDNAQEPGVLFQEDSHERAPEEQEDPELLEAVEEAIRLLFGVRGIHHIGPGTDDAGETVIVISVGQGFGEESMRRIPAAVRRFKTLVAIPFDLLPLKRSGP